MFCKARAALLWYSVWFWCHLVWRRDIRHWCDSLELINLSLECATAEALNAYGGNHRESVQKLTHGSEFHRVSALSWRNETEMYVVCSRSWSDGKTRNILYLAGILSPSSFCLYIVVWTFPRRHHYFRLCALDSNLRRHQVRASSQTPLVAIYRSRNPECTKHCFPRSEVRQAVLSRLRETCDERMAQTARRACFRLMGNLQINWVLSNYKALRHDGTGDQGGKKEGLN